MKDDITTYNKISLQADIKIVPFDVRKRYTKPHRHNKYLERYILLRVQDTIM